MQIVLCLGLSLRRVQAVPGAVRLWFAGVSPPAVCAALERYVTAVEAPHRIAAEVAAAEALREPALEISACGRAQEVVAAIEVDDDFMLQLSIRMPACYPLHTAEVRCCLPASLVVDLMPCCSDKHAHSGLPLAACSRDALLLPRHATGAATASIGWPSRSRFLPLNVTYSRLQVEVKNQMTVHNKTQRKWALSIASFLRNHNSSLADAVLMWKRNVTKEFEGVEPCMICYSVIHPTHQTLPKLKCQTCGQVFHSICLFKWFKSSGKSTCPHCQSPW